MEAFPIDAARAAFPSLGAKHIHLDNPAGTQVPRTVADAVARCLLETNANLGGYFQTSRAAGDVVEQAHRDAATLFGAANWREIVIGPSMTALTFLMSRSLGRTLSPGDEVVPSARDAVVTGGSELELHLVQLGHVGVGSVEGAIGACVDRPGPEEDDPDGSGRCAHGSRP